MRFQAKVNKILDHYFIMEGQNEDRALAMLKKAGKENYYNSLLELTADKNNKNKHLPILVKFFLEGQSIDIIKNYYDRYVSNTKLNQKPIDNLTFQQFEQMVDSAVVSTNVKTKTLDDKPLYEDQNVKIYLGDTKEKCIKYGQGSKYGFCIARSDASNLYWGYRSRGATFYFVYFKNKTAQAKAPSDLIVIHAYPNEQYQVNYSTPNKDFSKSKKEIVNEFPALDGILGKVIVHREHSEDEKKKLQVSNFYDINDLKTLEEKLLWVELGREIDYRKDDYDDWAELKYKSGEQAFNEVLKKYIEVGMHDVPKHIIKGTKYEKRYKEKLIQRAEAKVENYPPMSLSALQTKLTPDEIIEYVKKHKKKYDQEEIDNMLSELIHYMKKKDAFKELFELFHSEDKKGPFIAQCVRSAVGSANITILNYLMDEKNVDFEDALPILNNHDFLEVINANRKDEISHKVLNAMIDAYKRYREKFIEFFSDKKLEIRYNRIKQLGYPDLAQKYLSIFQETK